MVLRRVVLVSDSCVEEALKPPVDAQNMIHSWLLVSNNLV